MKTGTKIIIGVCIAIVPLVIVLRLTGVYNMYRIPTRGNAPTIDSGTVLFTSILKKPERGSFIAYKVDDIFEPGKRATYLFRLCAIGGDVIEMRDGLLWVNGRLADKPEKLMFSYKASVKDEMINRFPYTQDSDTTCAVSLTYEEAKGYKLPLNLFPRGYAEPYKILFSEQDSSWTRDNFGPVKVPAGKWLTLGDNRHNALDSRYTGFVDEKDFEGVVLDYE